MPAALYVDRGQNLSNMTVHTCCKRFRYQLIVRACQLVCREFVAAHVGGA